MIQIKERKEMEDSFKKAQKPWAKLLAKVNKTKVDYHTACKAEKTASNQERNASADSSLSPDQVCILSHTRFQQDYEMNCTWHSQLLLKSVLLFLIYIQFNHISTICDPFCGYF